MTGGTVRVPVAVAALLDVADLDDAECRGMGALWDLDALPGESHADRLARVELAERVCGRCRARYGCAQLVAAAPHPITGVVQAGARRGRMPAAGKGVGITALTCSDTVPSAACAPSHDFHRGGTTPDTERITDDEQRKRA